MLTPSEPNRSLDSAYPYQIDAAEFDRRIEGTWLEALGGRETLERFNYLYGRDWELFALAGASIDPDGCVVEGGAFTGENFERFEITGFSFVAQELLGRDLVAVRFQVTGGASYCITQNTLSVANEVHHWQTPLTSTIRHIYIRGDKVCQDRLLDQTQAVAVREDRARLIALSPEEFSFHELAWDMPEQVLRA